MATNNHKSKRIAVTGHRFITENQILTDSIKSSFNTISNNQDFSDLIIYSALAEGSDQIVANLVNEFPQLKLIVPLPLPIDNYLQYFESPTSIKRFYELLEIANEIIHLPTEFNHQKAYHNLGEFLVKKCDYLLAIWNGIYSNKKGGTGEVVKMAVEKKKTIFWIYSNTTNDQPSPDLQNRKKLGQLEIINF